MPWQPPDTDQPLQQAPAPATGGWQPPAEDQVLGGGGTGQAPSWQPRLGTTFLDAIKAGYQSSGTGLTLQGRLPDVVMDPHSEGWYHPFNTLAKGVSQLVSDAPEMFGGMVAGAAAGSEAPIIGNVIGGGIGAFAVPAAFRKALMLQYSQGSVSSVADFLERTAIVGGEAAKQGLVGGLTAGLGPLAQGALEPLAGATTAALGAKAAELGAMTLAPAALEGKLPEPEDFINGAILVGGLHAVGMVSGNLRSVYEKTGLKPDEAVAMAKQDPVLAQELQEPMGPAGVPKTLEPQANAEAIKSAIPGLPANRDLVSEVFGPTVRVPDPAPAPQINYQYIDTTSQMDGVLAKATELANEAIQTQRRGTQSWEQSMQGAVDLLNAGGLDVIRQPGTGATDAEIVARHWVVQGAVTDMVTQAKAFALLDNPTPEQVATFEAAMARPSVALAVAQFKGASAEIGRAMNAMKITDGVMENAQLIQEAVAKGGVAPKDLANLLAQLDSPEGAARAARSLHPASTWDQIMEGWKAGLLGPVTVIKKGLSDFTMLAARPLIDTVALGLDRVAGGTERMAAAEPVARVVGNYQAAKQGLVQAWETLKWNSEPTGGLAESQAAIPGAFGQVVRYPFKAIEAVTTLFQAMQERGEASAQAARRAAAEGLDPSTHEYWDKVADYATNEVPANAEEFAKRMTFSADLGPAGKNFKRLIGTEIAGGVKPLQVIFPFLKAPLNIFQESARLSPLAPLVGDWRADFAEGGIARSKAVAEMAVGTALTGLGLAWAAMGKISGSGDPDPNKARLQRAAGWQPYSINLDGKWYSYRMVHPVGTLLGLTADLHEMSDYLSADESDKAWKVAAHAFAHAVTEQTFLQGMTTLIHGLDDPARNGATVVQNLAASMVPATLTQTAALVHADPYKRQIDTIKDAVAARLPGLRENLEPQRDPFGQPIANDERVAGISPIVQNAQSTDLVRTEAARLSSIGNGLGAPAVPRSVELPNAGQRDVGKVPLSPEQRDLFGDVSGHLAYSIMEHAVADPRWATLPDAVKQTVFKQAFARGHQLGAATALSPQERQAEVQRIVGGLAQRFQQPSQ